MPSSPLRGSRAPISRSFGCSKPSPTSSARGRPLAPPDIFSIEVTVIPASRARTTHLRWRRRHEEATRSWPFGSLESPSCNHSRCSSPLRCVGRRRAVSAGHRHQQLLSAGSRLSGRRRRLGRHPTPPMIDGFATRWRGPRVRSAASTKPRRIRLAQSELPTSRGQLPTCPAIRTGPERKRTWGQKMQASEEKKPGWLRPLRQ